jgi:tRNA U34 2-thiouridine synthase MnmA/TrmU
LKKKAKKKNLPHDGQKRKRGICRFKNKGVHRFTERRYSRVKE